MKAAHPVRAWLVLMLMFAGFAVLAARAFQVQVIQSGYLKRQGDARQLRVVDVAASRGMLQDRQLEPLAVSTAIATAWADPAEFLAARRRWPALAGALEMAESSLARRAQRATGRSFMYLKRHIPPAVAARVTELAVPGVYLMREYKRFYPAGPITGHVVGFTDVDQRGLAGLELAFDERLRGHKGRKRVRKDGHRDVVEDVESLQAARDGEDVVVSLDRRIQYLAFRELKAAVLAHQARGGSAVVLDARTGEVLAMVNEPGFNPNRRGDLDGVRTRNRAVTDVFEPGSTLKPFTVAAGLESGKFSVSSLIDTSPGQTRIGTYTVRDRRNFGKLDLAGVISKSSNVGASTIAMAIAPDRFWTLLSRAGFGRRTASALPGERAGRLAPPQRWRPVERATLAFGDGISVTTLQLAAAYTAFANAGVAVPATLLRRAEPAAGRRVMSAPSARAVLSMLEGAVQGGTGQAARIPRYRVAGKTGTVHRPGQGGYAQDRYVASFVGLVPVSRPRLVMAVVIDDPRGDRHYGGQVAAPVFAAVLGGALRLLNVTPDDRPALRRARARARAGEAAS